jgi:6-O-methylguanine DNA methyltransferase, DNA binding domain
MGAAGRSNPPAPTTNPQDEHPRMVKHDRHVAGEYVPFPASIFIAASAGALRYLTPGTSRGNNWPTRCSKPLSSPGAIVRRRGGDLGKEGWLALLPLPCNVVQPRLGLVAAVRSCSAVRLAGFVGRGRHRSRAERHRRRRPTVDRRAQPRWLYLPPPGWTAWSAVHRRNRRPSNPIGIVVACHRVIGSDDSLTGYAGGLDRKRYLLAARGLGCRPRVRTLL